MAGATIVQAYRTKIATATGTPTFGAGMTNLPATIDIEDLPAGSDHQVFRLRGFLDREEAATSGAGSLVEGLGVMEVVVFWNPQLDEEAIADTIITDQEFVNQALRRVSNRPAGCLLVMPTSGWIIDDSLPNRVKATARYPFRYRFVQDLS